MVVGVKLPPRDRLGQVEYVGEEPMPGLEDGQRGWYSDAERDLTVLRRSTFSGFHDISRARSVMLMTHWLLFISVLGVCDRHE